jgi:uncharacterized protein YerC
MNITGASAHRLYVTNVFTAMSTYVRIEKFLHLSLTTLSLTLLLLHMRTHTYKVVISWVVK